MNTLVTGKPFSPWALTAGSSTSSCICLWSFSSPSFLCWAVSVFGGVLCISSSARCAHPPALCSPLAFSPSSLITLLLSLACPFLLLRPVLISGPLLLCLLSSSLSSLMVSLRKLCYFAKERRKWNSKFTPFGMKLGFLTQSREETAWMKEPQSYFQEAKTSYWVGQEVHMDFKS